MDNWSFVGKDYVGAGGKGPEVRSVKGCLSNEVDDGIGMDTGPVLPVEDAAAVDRPESKNPVGDVPARGAEYKPYDRSQPGTHLKSHHLKIFKEVKQKRNCEGGSSIALDRQVPPKMCEEKWMPLSAIPITDNHPQEPYEVVVRDDTEYHASPEFLKGGMAWRDTPTCQWTRSDDFLLPKGIIKDLSMEGKLKAEEMKESVVSMRVFHDEKEPRWAEYREKFNNMAHPLAPIFLAWLESRPSKWPRYADKSVAAKLQLAEEEEEEDDTPPPEGRDEWDCEECEECECKKCRPEPPSANDKLFNFMDRVFKEGYTIETLGRWASAVAEMDPGIDDDFSYFCWALREGLFKGRGCLDATKCCYQAAWKLYPAQVDVPQSESGYGDFSEKFKEDHREDIEREARERQVRQNTPAWPEVEEPTMEQILEKYREDLNAYNRKKHSVPELEDYHTPTLSMRGSGWKSPLDSEEEQEKMVAFKDYLDNVNQMTEDEVTEVNGAADWAQRLSQDPDR